MLITIHGYYIFARLIIPFGKVLKRLLMVKDSNVIFGNKEKEEYTG